MSNKTREDIDTQHGMIRRMREEAQISDSNFFRCIMSLAHDHMRNGDMEDARVLVGECTETYLSETLMDQMIEDPEFAVAMHQLAQRLAENNSAPESDPEEFLLTFSKVAKA
jgi:hypothetical protein